MNPSAIITKLGARWTIRRETAAAGANAWTEGAKTVAFYSCVGRSRGAMLDDLKAGATESESLLVIDAAQCAAPGGPLPGDRVAPGTITSDLPGVVWRQISNVDDPSEGGVVKVYRCRARK